MRDHVVLQDGLTRLVLSPQVGGSLVEWCRLSDACPLLRPGHPEATSPRQLACYPLIPWSNRVSRGGVDTPDGWLPLPANTEGSSLAIHGSAWQQPWEVVERDERSVLLRLDSKVPFAYRAEQRVTLEDGCLTIAVTVLHHDIRPMWHGFGLHPYFPRTAHTRVRVKADQVWLCDEQQLPTRLTDIPHAWALEDGQLPETRVDNAFVGWDGRCVIEQEDLGYRLDCEGVGFDYFLLFCPPEQRFFCFEPVSHPVNAHHLPGRPGLALLHRGECQHGTWRMRYVAQ